MVHTFLRLDQWFWFRGLEGYCLILVLVLKLPTSNMVSLLFLEPSVLVLKVTVSVLVLVLTALVALVQSLAVIKTNVQHLLSSFIWTTCSSLWNMTSKLSKRSRRGQLKLCPKLNIWSYEDRLRASKLPTLNYRHVGWYDRESRLIR